MSDDTCCICDPKGWLETRDESCPVHGRIAMPDFWGAGVDSAAGEIRTAGGSLSPRPLSAVDAPNGATSVYALIRSAREKLLAVSMTAELTDGERVAARLVEEADGCLKDAEAFIGAISPHLTRKAGLIDGLIANGDYSDARRETRRLAQDVEFVERIVRGQ